MALTEKLRHFKVVRGIIYIIVGFITYPGLAWINRIKISGTEYIKNLPNNNVLFVSNHQTYFADVITFIHIFCAVKWRKTNRLGLPYYLLNPFTNIYYVAAEDTMNTTWVSKLFKHAGALTVKRTWVEKDTTVRKGLDTSDTKKISDALSKSWVITFPQGTTTPYAPGRKGTAYIIKQLKPIVIPVVINGFSQAFSKRGLSFKKTGTTLSVQFKPALSINFEDTNEAILSQVMDAIEQSEKFKPQTS